MNSEVQPPRSARQAILESNTLQTQPGLSAGQTVQTAGTARNLVNRAAKVLLGVLAGSESELETCGFQVVVSMAAGPMT